MAQAFLGLKDPEFLFDVIIHLGTLLATVLIFYKEIIKLFTHPRAILLIIVAGIPTAIMGFVLVDYMEKYFWSMKEACIELIMTGFILWFTQYAPSKKIELEETLFSNITIPKAFLIGIAQGISIFPGISRSGLTIATALFLKTGRRDAAVFSFLLSIPSIIGAVGLKLLKTPLTHFHPLHFGIGFTTSLLLGTISLLFLIKLVLEGKFYKFSYYCWIVGSAALIASYYFL